MLLYTQLHIIHNAGITQLLVKNNTSVYSIPVNNLLAWGGGGVLVDIDRTNIYRISDNIL
jgi:hypothetical protein